VLSASIIPGVYAGKSWAQASMRDLELCGGKGAEHGGRGCGRGFELGLRCLWPWFGLRGCNQVFSGLCSRHKFLTSTSDLVVKMTRVTQKKKQSQRTVSPDARVRDLGVEVARNGGFRRRINTDPSKSCFMRMGVECARVNVVCVVHAKSGVARRPRWPQWLSIALRWPTSHRGFGFSMYYGL
jgi:hypothetical protein